MLLLALPLLLPAPLQANPAVDLRVAPLPDLWFSVREKSATGTMARDNARGHAIEAVRKLDAAFGQPILWGFVEGRLPEAATCDDLAKVFATLPDKFQARGMRQEIDLRHFAGEIATKLRAIEADFMKKEWERARTELEEQRERVARSLAGEKGAEIVAALAKGLGLDVPEAPVPVYLVRLAPPPGGFSHKAAGGGAVSFVATEGVSEALLIETVLHELIHAMEVSTTDGEDVLARLRAALRERGVPVRSRHYRDAVHTLYFLHAADVVRAHVDPEHVDYGESQGYYEQVPEITAIERPLWKRYREGELDAGALVDAIAEAVAAL
jgi:hypothetical protein